MSRAVAAAGNVVAPTPSSVIFSSPSARPSRSAGTTRTAPSVRTSSETSVGVATTTSAANRAERSSSAPPSTPTRSGRYSRMNGLSSASWAREDASPVTTTT